MWTRINTIFRTQYPTNTYGFCDFFLALSQDLIRERIQEVTSSIRLAKGPVEMYVGRLLP
jgi:hypothetical protein